ncbi:MAG: hypothetical protein GF308_04520 [Candidatus Heimdallarchaeota archaeon]|nr:hypothetical protein [Candidatus Heimdallarchaeota archaeon]
MNKKNKESIKKSTIEEVLWKQAKKYKGHLDQKKVLPVAESEADRQEVSKAYQQLITQRHWQLDARVYKSLSTMQRIRDTKVALEGSTEQDRLRMVAWEVKIRLQPIITLLGETTLNPDIFELHDGEEIRIIEGDDEELVTNDESLPVRLREISTDLPLRELTQEEITRLKLEIIQQFVGKTFTRKEFEQQLTSIHADLLSLMVREKEILLLKKSENKFEILSTNDKKLVDNRTLKSRSIVLAPKKD